MRNLKTNTLLFELSKPGRRGAHLPACDVPSPELQDLLPAEALAVELLPLPEVAEPEVVRHFTNLSTLNMSVDTHFYPLGSCTMKYNSKRNERIAGLPGLADLHPYQPESTLQGILQLFHELQQFFGEISGLPAVSLQPAAGAHGELAALMVAAAHFRTLGQKRNKVLAPDSAHGTNPASAKMAGFEFVTVKSTPEGNVDLADLRSKLDDTVAVFMITNPNTLGMFDKQVGEISKLVHSHGGLIYLDGANMNAILGIARPGDFGADMMHYNPHKTFSGPHGGGGPGAGPICVTETLRPFLPCPVVEKTDGIFRLVYDKPQSIGGVRSFFGNVGVLVRAYCYIRTHGPNGLKRVSETAVLNANYLLSKVKHFLPVPQGPRCMHEFVASGATLKKQKGISAMDVAKRLLDYGFHAPTVYFPLTVPEAMMIEPTETESKETLDSFAETLFRITEESADLLHEAPHSTPISRPDEVRAARQPMIKWTPAATERAIDPMPAAHLRVILDPPATGVWNMAVDEALLHSTEYDGLTLRFYQWSEPTLSLGYFQSLANREQHSSSRDCPVVRRASGGGAILHDRELTYSLVAPVSPRFGDSAQELYDLVHLSLCDVLSEWNIHAQLF